MQKIDLRTALNSLTSAPLVFRQDEAAVYLQWDRPRSLSADGRVLTACVSAAVKANLCLLLRMD